MRTALFFALVAAGCESGTSSSRDAVTHSPDGPLIDSETVSPGLDAALRDARPSPPTPDAAPLAPDAGSACACEADETCEGCFAHLGACCFEDETIFGQVGVLAANCDGRADCRVCCRECEATPCEALVAGGSCPAR